MKTNHRARADFLRELKTLTNELYSLGDFTSSDPGRALFEAKLDGFIQAGLLIEVVTRDEMQQVIDDCHFTVFGEARSDRRERLNSENAALGRVGDEDPELPDWGSYDTPAIDRVPPSRSRK